MLAVEEYACCPVDRRVVRNRLLQSNDTELLDTATQNAEQDPALSALLVLRIEHQRLEQRADQLSRLKPEDPMDSIVEGTETWSSHPNRGTATYFNNQKLPSRVPVLIEKKEVPNEPRNQRHRERTRNLARLLSMEGKPREMRTPHCLGTVPTGDKHLPTAYRLIYRLPVSRFFPLKDILSTQRNTKRPTLPLRKRFACAKVLCRALPWIHLAAWLHKDIRSDNIILCADDEAQVNLAEPYLCGFEYSCLMAAPLDTEPLSGGAGNNLYRHPDVQGLPKDSRDTERPEFDNAHDVYALGIVLLELGSHRSLQGLKEKYEKQFAKRWSAEPFRKWIAVSELQGLAPRMGEIYTDVVRCCLNGLKRDDELSFQETFL